MSSIIKEYLLLIIGAALAVAVLIWYLKRQGAAATAKITAVAKEYKADVSTITTAATTKEGWGDMFNMFKGVKYISPEDQKKALAEINAKMFKK